MYCSNKITYIIKKGDTLYTLAENFGTSVESLLSLNPSLNPNNLTIGSTVIICPKNNGNSENSSNNVDKAMRLAWLQNVYWTRMLIISTIDRLSDLTATTERLMQNPKITADIFADNVQPFNVLKIEDLLGEDLKICSELVVALRDNDMQGAEGLSRAWYKNADMLVEALKSAVPAYNAEKLHSMLFNHLDMTLRQIGLRLAKKYTEEINVFNDIEQEILSFADYLAAGLKRVAP